MASIWLHEPGKKQPRKLKGHMDPIAARARLAQEAERLAKANKCDIISATADEVFLQFTDKGKQRFTLFVEHLSPPSAPEGGQPKIVKGRGILKLAKGQLDLGKVG
jgi:hypothetical protein